MLFRKHLFSYSPESKKCGFEGYFIQTKHKQSAQDTSNRTHLNRFSQTYSKTARIAVGLGTPFQVIVS